MRRDDQRSLRALTPSEVETLVGWAAGEGWNPGVADAPAFHAADPDGFLGAFVDGELAAGVSAVAYGDGFGFIGLYICRPDMRGRNHGRAVWEAGLARLAGRTVGLDGVAAQQANYRSKGFAPAYRTIRYAGRPNLHSITPDRVEPVSAALRPQVETYDRACFPAARPGFLDLWLAPPRGALAVLREGSLCGYGVIRECRAGFKIGPLFADDLDAATSLLAALAQLAGGDMVQIDVPDWNGDFIEILADVGLLPGFETMRMYKGPAPAVDRKKIFGITTLELG